MREMRRTDRMLSQEETIEIVTNGEYGILSTADGTGQPYGVPLSYVLDDDFIYFHSTNAGGSKYDHILENEKVCFTIVGKTKVIPEKFGTLYESAIILGKAITVTEEKERLKALRGLIRKYSPEFQAEGEKYIENAGSLTMVVKITIDQCTGKSRK